MSPSTANLGPRWLTAAGAVAVVGTAFIAVMLLMRSSDGTRSESQPASSSLPVEVGPALADAVELVTPLISGPHQGDPKGGSPVVTVPTAIVLRIHAPEMSRVYAVVHMGAAFSAGTFSGVPGANGDLDLAVIIPADGKPYVVEVMGVPISGRGGVNQNGEPVVPLGPLPWRLSAIASTP